MVRRRMMVVVEDGGLMLGEGAVMWLVRRR